MRIPRGKVNVRIERAQDTTMLEAIVDGLEVYKNATGRWPEHISMSAVDIEKLRKEMKEKCNYFNSGYTKGDAPMAVYGVPVIEG